MEVGFARNAEILLVEDSLADIRLTEEALKEGKCKVNLHIVNDGVEAMEFLRKENKYANVPTPDLILLDLNMPRKDGREVLKDIKDDAVLSSIPVIILTISQAEEDILLSYKYHVNCYIRKPLDMKKFIEMVKAVQSFWFTIVTLPQNK
ncbi:MAG: response regulator [Gammaproteobacteria bacterium]|nr:response regulator [Gammaproteobacteria bacterium]